MNPIVGIILAGWLLGVVFVIGGLWRLVSVARDFNQHLGEIRKRLDRISDLLDELPVHPIPDDVNAGHRERE